MPSSIYKISEILILNLDKDKIRKYRSISVISIDMKILLHVCVKEIMIHGV